MPIAVKKSNITLIHKKEDTKELKNYRLVRLLSVVYNLYTKAIVNRISDSLEFEQPREEAVLAKGNLYY